MVNVTFTKFRNLCSRRLCNIGSAVLGNSGGASRSTRVKLVLLAFPYSYTARPKLLKRLLRRLQIPLNRPRGELNCDI